MAILELSDQQVVGLLKQLPPAQKRAALLALAELLDGLIRIMSSAFRWFMELFATDGTRMKHGHQSELRRLDEHFA